MAKSDTLEAGEILPEIASPYSPGETLETVLKAARIADPVIAGLQAGEAHVLLPDGFTLKDISNPHRLPPHIRQRVTVDDADSLIQYANRFSDLRSVIIADLDALAIMAALDWHVHNGTGPDCAPWPALDPQPVQHKASLVLRNSEEFARWDGMQGQMHDQMTFAEFLDENASDIAFPEPAVMIEIARDLEATQGVKFKAGTRLQTGERSFSYETETHVREDLVVPQRFTLSIPLFHGEEPTEVECSFRFRPQPDGLKLGFVWRRVEYVRQAKFREIAHRVSENTGLPVFHGRAV